MENDVHSTHESEEPVIKFRRANIILRLGSGAMDIFILLILTYFIPILGALIGVAYYLFKDALPFLNGQSIGKKIFQIQVQNRLDNSATTNEFGLSFTRSMPVLIPILNLIELILVLSKKRRFGDQWAKTFVVSEDKEMIETF